MTTELIQVVEDDSLERSGRCLTHHPLKLGALANSAPQYGPHGVRPSWPT
jgi:hypothetical protein